LEISVPPASIDRSSLPEIAAGAPSLEDGAVAGKDGQKAPQEQQTALDNEPPADHELLRLAKAAETQAVTFAQQNWRPAQEKSYKAFRSEYVDNSKYKSDDFRHRSKIFRPKTRIAVTKNMASAAQTMFSTIDAVSVTAGDESDELQLANAELNKALINYRLDRTSGKNSISWFLTAMGALQDCNIAGICVSKQYWSFQEKMKNRLPVIGKDGKVVKIKDKPEIELIAPENAGLDPAASWIDPVQSGSYFYAKYPMHIFDVKRMMNDRSRGWRPLPKKTDGTDDDSAFTSARVRDFDASGVRRSREGGADRMDNTTVTDPDFEVVWVCEWFIRKDDEDWNFWTLGNSHMLSDAESTDEAYPWKGGERPYKIGYGNLEAHRIVPQSPVETWNPLQAELNDITNLRLDTLKQVIQPVALVKRGRKIDTDALKRRYPVLFVDNPKEDVQWDRPPDSAASAFAETSKLDTDFDDLSGNFNGGSVANNRQVGETVGGMRLMNASASATSEFFTRLWVETWVEPVLADLSKLEAYYESDTKILALAKKRAPSMAKFGIDGITDELLEQEVVVRVSAGLGSPDPTQKMNKIGSAMAMTKPIVELDPRFRTGEIRINSEALINEIWGNAGIRDGFDRFFEHGEAMPQPGEQPEPNPAADPAVLADKQADRSSKENIAKLKAKTEITKTIIGARTEQRAQARDHKTQGKHKFMDVMMQALGEHQAAKDRDADRKIAASSSIAT
jgi:hypothetical protein